MGVVFNPFTGQFDFTGSGGGGAVDSVNGQTGTVVLDADDVLPTQTGNSGKFLTTDGSTSSWGTPSGSGDMLASTYDPQNIGDDAFNQDNMTDGTTNKNYTATEQTKLAGIAAGANVGVVPNSSITGATKTKITYDSKGLVTAGADATTADISDSINKRYVTDADLTLLGNTSGTNTGDQDLSGYALTSSLADVATSGAYSDLSGVPGLATVATTGAYNDLSGKPTLATVATSGSYNDLSDKPTIPPSPLTWSEVTGTSQSAVVNTGYITNNASLVTVTLPSTAALGSKICITGKGAGGWKLAQNSGQTVNIGSLTTTSGTGGSLASFQRYDSIELVCITANSAWNVISSQGSITVV